MHRSFMFPERKNAPDLDQLAQYTSSRFTSISHFRLASQATKENQSAVLLMSIESCMIAISSRSLITLMRADAFDVFMVAWFGRFGMF